jgi:prepilin-type N-terminal cleavage/methylation domain-containing protein
MKKNKGYTLIEMLIVISIVGLIMPAIFTILFVIIQQQLRIYRIIETKKQGDYVLTFIKNKVIEDAVKITDATTEQCAIANTYYPPLANGVQPTNNGSTFFFQTTQATTKFNFYIDTASNSIDNNSLVFNETVGGTVTPTQITSKKVVISNLAFQCVKKTNTGGALVRISYVVTYNSTLGDPVSYTYSTKVKLRTY